MSSSKDHKYDITSTSLNATLSNSQSNNEHSHILPHPQLQQDPPLYIKNDSTLRERISQLAQLASSNECFLPIHSYPQTKHCNPNRKAPSNGTQDATIKHRQDIVIAYFDAIKTKKDEVVAALIESNLVTPETTNVHGQTPLHAAIEAGNVHTVQQLMDFDADVNAFSAISRS